MIRPRAARRTTVALLALLVPTLVACTARWETVPPLELKGRPSPVDATRFPTRFPIKHVVFLIKENRTYDHLFGTFPGGNGTTVGMDRGQPRPLQPGTDQRVPGDIPHCYNCALVAWNGGQNDQFDQGPMGDWAYTQLAPDQLPNYWHWAEQNVLFDNFFASAVGPS